MTRQKKHKRNNQVIHYRSWYLLGGLICCNCSMLLAQNLVPNPGFENYTSCPANNVFTAANWYSPTTGSPDYFHPCGTGWTPPGPSILFGPQTAHTGSAFAGIGWYGLGGGWYEYIQVQLITPMIAGEAYTVSMWVSLADQVRKASDDMGIYISTNKFKSSASIQPSITTVIPTAPVNFGVFTTFTPQIKFADGVFITDVTGWTLVSGTYLASGGEQVITLGCFEPWTTTGTLVVNAAGNDRSYYYVDDVSVEKLGSLPVNLVSFEGTAKDHDQILLNWTTATEQNACDYEIERSDDPEHFETIAKIMAAGTVNHSTTYTYTDTNKNQEQLYYRLKQTDCDGRYIYSQTIVVFPPGKKQWNAYPNPVAEHLFIDPIDKMDGPVNILVYNITGQKILDVVYDQEEKIQIPFAQLDGGVYILSIVQDKRIVQHKIIKR